MPAILFLSRKTVREVRGRGASCSLLEESVRANAALEMTTATTTSESNVSPYASDPIGLERLGTVVGYFIDTVDFNLQKRKQGEGRFERYAITMEGLAPQNFAAFDELIREKGQEFLEVLDDWLGQHEIKGGHRLPPSDSIRTGVGVFHFIENSPITSDDSFR